MTEFDLMSPLHRDRGLGEQIGGRSSLGGGSEVAVDFRTLKGRGPLLDPHHAESWRGHLRMPLSAF